jgi:hypothetical protein
VDILGEGGRVKRNRPVQRPGARAARPGRCPRALDQEIEQKLNKGGSQWEFYLGSQWG